MKFFRYIALLLLTLTMLAQCSKESQSPWSVDIKKTLERVQVKDLSAELYDQNVRLDQFKAKYPWFQGSVSDSDFAERRADPEEIAIYKEAAAKIDQVKLNKDLGNLFAHVRYYFTDFKNPQVFLFSSALQGIREPIFYNTAENMLFIDITGFMGENHPDYKGLENYFQTSMNPQNIVPKVSEIIAENYIPRNREHQKFIDDLIYNGKIEILQDAFLPGFPDHLKMNYTPKQYEWAVANEGNVWNFFVENNLVFSDDTRLNERFIKPGPFSKFYTEVDNKSSPQIGIFTGWHICKKFLEENPEVKLQKFLAMDAQEIFAKSLYKPKN